MELRINYLCWNLALALVTKAFTLRAKWSLWSPSPAGSKRLLLFCWDWFSSGCHQQHLQNPLEASTTQWACFVYCPQEGCLASVTPSSLGRPPNPSSTHPSLSPILLSSQVSLPWPKYKKCHGHLLGQLWKSCLAGPRGRQGLFLNPSSHGLLDFPSVLTITVSTSSSWNSCHHAFPLLSFCPSLIPLCQIHRLGFQLCSSPLACCYPLPCPSPCADPISTHVSWWAIWL